MCFESGVASVISFEHTDFPFLIKAVGWNSVEGSRLQRSVFGMPYEDYFKAASESLIIVDRTGRILEANPKTTEVFGYRLDELIGQPLELLLPEQLGDIHRRHREDYFSGPRSRPMGVGLNLVARRKDGTEFPVEVSLTYAPGTSRGSLVVAAVVDITNRLTLELAARRTETVTSLGTFAAGIAHDLNNPLQILLSRGEMLLRVPDLAPEVREDLEVLHRQAQRAARIVEEFLRLSRLRVKTVDLLDLNGLVERALLLTREQMRKDGVEIEMRLERNLPPVMADATALERVLINLLTNAHDATRSGGAIKIETGLLSDRPDWLYLTVADNGPGIHPDHIGKIFDLLFTTKPGGSGIGLWLSRRIVQESNGRIEVQSELGNGASFTITLPAEDALPES